MTRTVGLWLLGAVVSAGAGVGGCGGTSDRWDEANLNVDVGAPVVTDAPSIIEVNGRTLMRREDWSDDDFERIVYEGRANQDSTNPSVLAAQLRAHTVRNGQYYIELEPNLELAQKILSSPTPGPTKEQGPREERTIVGSDTRSHWSLPNQVPAILMGFNNSGGSGAKIASHAMYTAAHVVYDTFTVPNGWFCANSTRSSSCNPWPAWRFGVEGTNGFTNWTTNGCYAQTIPNAFVSLTVSDTDWTTARWDYSAIDTTACTDGNTGWFGTLIATDSQLLSFTGQVIGYADRAPCPLGSYGTDGTTSNSSTDCPGSGSWPGSTWQLNGLPNVGQPPYTPFTGARLWIGSGAMQAGGGNPTYSIQSDVDITKGESGAPIYTQALGSRQALGTLSGDEDTYNIYSRFTSETYNAMHAWAPSFPPN